HRLLHADPPAFRGSSWPAEPAWRPSCLSMPRMRRATASEIFSRESNFYNSTAMSRHAPHLALLLERASRAVAERLSRSIGFDGVTSDYWRVLRLLADEEGHPMGEIAERLAMNPPTLTKL